MDAVQWTQETAVELEPMTEVAAPITRSRTLTERRVRPQKDQALNCQRCHSTNTKFCYYNNYNLSQPRYFCKTCRRYWTEGGSLRNVPVGGGSRKNRRSNRSSLSTTSSSITTITSSSASSYKLPHHDPNPPNFSHFSFQNPNPHDGQNLNLSFPPSHQYYGLPQFIELPKTHENKNNNHLSSFTYSSSSSSSSSSPSSVSTTTTPLPSLELLRTGINASSGGLSSSNDDNNINNNIPTPIPNSNILYTSGFGFQEIKPNLTFSIDGIEKGHGGLHGVQENGKALLFPFGAFKQLPTTSEVDQNKAQSNSAGYWNGMFGGGSW